MVPQATIDVMIVDDDPEDIDFLKSGFANRADAFWFIEHTGGQSALDYLAGIKDSGGSATFPHIIFLDLHLPGKTGYEVLKEIRDEVDFTAIPIVVLSSSMLQSDEEKCFAMGCDGFITKPVSLDAYHQAVTDTLRHLTENGKL